MNTKIIKIDVNNIIDEDLQLAATILKNGGLVAFPTETVYGIGANALDEEAIKNIYIAKGRPSDNPLIVHVSNIEAVYQYTQDVPSKALKLMDKYWPGPLTIILKKNEIIPNTITGGLDTVALRMPSNKIARQLISLSELPIAAPSANTSGKPSPTLANHVIQDLDGKVDMIIDGGNSTIGVESTVIDLTSEPPVILRPGGVTKEMIETVIGEIKIDQSIIGDIKAIPKSPGMKYKHYAPKGKLFVVRGKVNNVVEEINKQVKEKEVMGSKVAVIATKENSSLFKCSNIVVIGSYRDQKEIAANLFKILRKMDDDGVDYIFSEEFSREDIGLATMNRLLKAAGNNIINVLD